MHIFFSVLAMLGGLAMFLYGMRIMSNNLKESSSGTLKVVMEKVTNNPIKAFLLGLIVTGIIQSSTACIVITSGLVAAGIIRFENSIGVIVGANVGTTVTGQIIRLLDVQSDEDSLLNLFTPNTLSAIAMIVGIVIIMGFSFKNANNIGTIVIGFGLLFYGLLAMKDAVSSFQDSLGGLFTSLGDKPILGYLSGAGVAFILQSSSATVGILQAFSSAGQELTFKAVYIILCGIYLGDCVTTAIVCSIGAKPDAKRVGLVNILFNLSETILVVIAVNVVRMFGALDTLWDLPLTAGGIANTNTVFNLSCAILLLPLVGVYSKIAKKVIKDENTEVNAYQTDIEALNPTFFSTPALAFRSCYDVLTNMLHIAKDNVNASQNLLKEYDVKSLDNIKAEEKRLDYITDQLSSYLVKLSQHIRGNYHISILDQYYKLTNEFERLGDYAVNIAEAAETMQEKNVAFSETAQQELDVIRQLLDEILAYTQLAFEKRDVEAARKIEPLEEVMDDLTNALHDNHLARLRDEKCNIVAGTGFLDILSNIERISDTCSNVGVATVARVDPKVANQAHKYISALHQGKNRQFNEIYHSVHDIYFDRLPSEEPCENPDQQTLFVDELSTDIP